MPRTTSMAARHLSGTQSPSPAPQKEPRLRGALRGLDSENMLEQPVIETSTEATACEASVEPPPRHATRSTRNGRADVNYSQKYHPMDEVTRPKRARRITGSRSLSAAAETSDEEEPELYSGESSDVEDPSEEPDSPATRIPDPRAVRHSARTVANKPVNYDKNHHPQDHAIFGRRRFVKRKRQSVPVPRPQKRAKGQVAPEKPIVLSSDKSSDSDSDAADDEVEVKNGNGNDPPVIHSPSSTASSPERQAESPDPGYVHNDGSNPVPALPRGESSFDAVDAIIKGDQVARLQRIKQAATGQDIPTIDDPSTKFVGESIKDIGTAMQAILDDVKTPDVANSDTVRRDHTRLDEPSFAPPSATTPSALVTHISMGIPTSSDKSFPQPSTQLAIKRPYMATQSKFPNTTDLQKSDQIGSVGETSSKTLSASLQSSTPSQPEDDPPENGDDSLGDEEAEEDNQPDTPSAASQEPVCDDQENEASVTHVVEVTRQLSHASASRDYIPLETSGADTHDVSRQVSRDTLPDDPNSSFFKDAMDEQQDCSQRDCDDDDLLRSSTLGLSQLPVSQRERSVDSALEERSSSEEQHRIDPDNGEQHPSSEHPSSAQPHGGTPAVQQLSPSSFISPLSTETAGQTASASEDSMPLKDISA